MSREHQAADRRLDRRWLTRRELGLLGVAGALGGWWLYAQDGRERFRPQRVLGRQPPITEAPIVSAAEANRILNPEELVLGVALDKQARAYPINMLTGPRREIINDTFAGRPIAATW
ncbi:MAG: DUF3179 domain-containing protein [Planctomycetota bacterium]|nr:MAG: DUF3179 domain-containing protein [Planctomycetota bacterium]